MCLCKTTQHFLQPRQHKYQLKQFKEEMSVRRGGGAPQAEEVASAAFTSAGAGVQVNEGITCLKNAKLLVCFH